jgi:hypothetical protein
MECYNYTMAAAANVQLPPLNKKSMTDLVNKAKRLGMEPGDYAKKLIEEGLALQRDAETSSFAQIMGPVRDAAGEVDDVEIGKLVETARTAYHRRARRTKR